jgi:hypothetical protein
VIPVSNTFGPLPSRTASSDLLPNTLNGGDGIRIFDVSSIVADDQSCTQ